MAIKPLVRKGKEAGPYHQSQCKANFTPARTGWLRTPWVHSSGGLGTVKLSTSVMLARKKATEEMIKSTNQIAQEIGKRMEAWNDERVRRLGLTGASISALNEQVKINRSEKIGAQN